MPSCKMSFALTWESTLSARRGKSGLGHGEHGLEYPAFSTTLHLLFPALLCLSLADGPIDEPADMPESEFPCRTLAFLFNGTLSYVPAPALCTTRRIAVSEKKQRLSLDMNRNWSPALLKALHSFKRSSQQLGHLFLGLAQLSSNLGKVPFLQLPSLSLFTPQCDLFKNRFGS